MFAVRTLRENRALSGDRANPVALAQGMAVLEG